MDKENDSPFPNPFWDFALRVYGREAVREQCLDLQDRHGADVNLMLFLLWRDDGGAAPPEMPEIEAMMAATEAVRTRAIEPLRGLRRILKRPFPDDLPVLRESLRQRMLEAELAAEAIAQTLLYLRFPVGDGATPHGTPALALARYLGRIGLSATEARTAAEALAAAAT